MSATVAAAYVLDCIDLLSGRPDGHTRMSAAVAAAYVLDCIGLLSGRPDGHTRISAAVAAAYVLDCIGLSSGRPDGRIRISAAVAAAHVLDCIGLSSGRQRVSLHSAAEQNAREQGFAFCSRAFFAISNHPESRRSLVGKRQFCSDFAALTRRIAKTFSRAISVKR
jgi:hypothetical protein